MRTLLIDNYDSFTFNVGQAIAAVNGEPPLVVRNDQYTYDELIALDFDNIVISPGPGTPDSDRDFGVCRDVVLKASQPILGICMGFQGIALLGGGRVVPSPEPWHGRGCLIRHDGTDLFEGIPSPFFGIRYHSLHVPSLVGTDLIETARTDDGILMALRHPRRPVWGVQFHPESVSTEHGRRIFENFRDLSEQGIAARGRSGRSVHARASDRTRAPDRSSPISSELQVRWEKVAGAASPETVFSSLFADREPCVWLDSSLRSADRSRFSFMASVCHESDSTVTYRSRDRRLEIVAGGTRTVVEESIFDHLKQALGRHHAGSSTLPFEFCGGYIGYFGYELKGECGGGYRHDSDLPDAFFMRISRFVAFDHASRDCYVVGVGEGEDHARWIRSTVSRIEGLRSVPPPVSFGPSPETVFAMEQDRDRYTTAIRVALDKIRAGESYQVCLTNRAEGRFTGDPFGLYRVLRRRNPAPFSAFLKTESFSVLCSSPERFLSISTEGSIEACPIKGTAPRSPDRKQDTLNSLGLVQSEKNRSENLMIADLLRNDLGRVAEIDSVRVPSLMTLESFETVHHLVSTVRARLSDAYDAVDCIRAAFPGGSMTGAPKIRTMEIIDGLESSARGVYSGALGYLSFSGAVDLNIVIRTMVVSGERIRFGMGGGVVALSVPSEEFDEALLKGRALVEAALEYSAGMEGTVQAVGPNPSNRDVGTP